MTASHSHILNHNFPLYDNNQWHEHFTQCNCELSKILKERMKTMSEEEREENTLFGTPATRIPIGDVIRARRIGFGRLEQKRIDQESREDRIKWIHKVESAITFLQSYRAGAKQSLDIELYELNEEARARQLQKDHSYVVKLTPQAPKTDKSASNLAKALETLGLTASDLKKLKG